LAEFSRQSQNLVFGRLPLVCDRPSVRGTFGSYVDAARHFPDYKWITEEDLDEFSTVGRKMIAEIAAGARCAIRIEGGRVTALSSFMPHTKRASE
jgi:hypothetical protein